MHTGPTVKAWQWMLLGFITLLLTLSVVVAQGAFRLERTFFSYGFTSLEAQRILKALDDPEVFKESIKEVYRLVLRSLPQTIPRELEPHLLRAAEAAFDPAWTRQTAAAWITSLQKVLDGKSATLSLPLSIGPFLRKFQSSIVGKYAAKELVYINREIDKIPGSIDAAEGLPPSLRTDIVFLGRFMALIQILLQYIVPGLLMAACFFHRRPGPGILAVGSAFLLGSVPGILTSTFFAGAFGRNLEGALSRQLPSALAWFAEGLGRTLETALRSGLTTAVLTGVFGAAMIGLGVFVMRGKRWPNKGPAAPEAKGEN